MPTIINGTTGVSQVQSTVDLSANVKTALNASGDAPIYACRAWVNFNGTGTVAIRASGNVSSITDNGAGDYVVNFTTAMSDANYSVAISSGGDIGSAPFIGIQDIYSSSSFRFKIYTNALEPIDLKINNIQIFR